MTKDLADETTSIDESTYVDASVSALKAVIEALTGSTRDFLQAEIERIIDNDAVRFNIKAVMPYLYAGAFLSLAGREINEENLKSVFKSIGISPDAQAGRILFKAKVRSHLVYIYAYYLLLALGNIPSESEILNIVNGLGLESDPSRIKDVMDFLQAPRPKL